MMMQPGNGRISYVDIGETPGASKLTKAQKLGTKLVDETALIKLMEQ